MLRNIFFNNKFFSGENYEREKNIFKGTVLEFRHLVDAQGGTLKDADSLYIF